MAIGQLNNTLSTIDDAEIDCQQSLLNDHQKPSAVRTAQTNLKEQQLEETKQNDKFYSDYPSNAKVAEGKKDYKEAFLDILEQLQTIQDGHLRTINTATPHV